MLYINNMDLTTTDKDIDEMMSNEEEYRGCVMRDEVHRLRQEKECFIVNLQTKRETGTHWCLLYNNPPKFVLYVDPFGAPPPTIIENRMRGVRVPMYISNLKLQNNNSRACGYLSCFIYKLIRGVGKVRQIDHLLKSTKMVKFLRHLDHLERNAREEVKTTFSKRDING